MKGLSPQIKTLFEQISKLECIKDYTLGGAALSLQLGYRLSYKKKLKLRKTQQQQL